VNGDWEEDNNYNRIQTATVVGMRRGWE